MADDGLLALAVARLPNLSHEEKLLLYDSAGDADVLSKLSRRELEAVLGRPVREDRWRPAEIVASAREDRKILTRRGISYTFYWCGEYPPPLREIYDPPFLLFYRGRLPRTERPAVAMVGTRRPTGAALHAAFKLSYELASRGVPIVSGLARGVDRAAHEGALRAGGTTVAVMGSGIDSIYPRENRKLAEQILTEGGALLSEYPPGAPALKFHFPQRNRIVSGLARSVVVVQAPVKSGALITAEFALEEGRDVFVHRDCLDGSEGAGTAALADDGAPTVRCAEEIFAYWGEPFVEPASPAAGRPQDGRLPEDAGGGCPETGAALARSLSLELSGELIRHRGGYFRSR
jgi:DNA processing protein